MAVSGDLSLFHCYARTPTEYSPMHFTNNDIIHTQLIQFMTSSRSFVFLLFFYQKKKKENYLGKTTFDKSQHGREFNFIFRRNAILSKIMIVEPHRWIYEQDRERETDAHKTNLRDVTGRNNVDSNLDGLATKHLKAPISLYDLCRHQGVWARAYPVTRKGTVYV